MGRWRYRIPLWVGLVTLAVFGLRYPIDISPSMSPVQTVGIFQNFPQFAGLFVSCMVVLFFLLFRDIGKTKNYERIPLICIFALVFVGFWILKTPYGVGADGMWFMAQAENLNIPTNFLGWFIVQPFLYVFTNAIYSVSHLDMFTVAQAFRIVSLLLFAVATYWFCRNALKDTKLALIATVGIAVLFGALSAGGGLVRTTFRPDLLSGVFWMTAMALIFKDNKPLGNRRDLVFVIVLIILTAITYSVHALVLCFVTLGVFVLGKVGRKPTVPLAVVIVAVVVLIPFALQKSHTLFGESAEMMVKVTQNVRGEAVAPSTSLVEIAPSVGQAVREAQTQQYSGIFASILNSFYVGTHTDLPWWAALTKYLKWLLLGFGSVLAVIFAVRVRKRKDYSPLAGGILGLAVLSLVLAILSYRGFEYSRYLIYSPLFICPFLVKFFADVWWRSTRVLILVLLFLTLPSFLSLDTSMIGMEKVYKQEIASGEFLRDRHGDGEGLQIYTNFPTNYFVANYYVPKAEQYGTQSIFWTPDRKGLEKNLEALVETYEECEGECVFVYSEKVVYSWCMALDMSPDDEVWGNLKAELEEPLFGNEYVSIYAK